jgi:membrane-bound ClpP family serine protease
MISSKRVIFRYILFQIPAIILVLVIVLWLYYASVISEYIVIITIILWMLKDFVLFFFVWKAYEVSSGIPLAEKGVTIEDLDPEGYVEVGSELWRATTGDENVRIDKGIRVIIKSVRGLTLLVVPEE